MARYLYGKVSVQAILIDADDEAKALEMLKNTNSQPGKVLLDYKLHWGEVPETDITHERDGVLAQFLNLMQNEIPRGNPSNIIVPDASDNLDRPQHS